MRVLHVIEAMGGGIVSSVLSMVEATPEVDHHLLARARAVHDTGDDWAAPFSSVHVLPDNPLRALQTVRRLSRDLYPDVVHAHSSWGGALVRMAGIDRPRIVYSPHCFAFERRDISGTQRRLYETVERTLAARTDLVIAVAPYEIDLAAELGHREIAYAPNRTLLENAGRAAFAHPLRIVAAGRICPQKDWRYFLHVKRYAEAQLGVQATWQWLGGGDAEGERTLAQAGVDVTGWITRAELLDLLTHSQVYVHTAAWEAAPMSVLEAAAIGLPMAVRAISPLESLDLPGLARSVKGLAERIHMLADPDVWTAEQAASDDVSARHSRGVQGYHLRDAYDRVCAADGWSATGSADHVVSSSARFLSSGRGAPQPRPVLDRQLASGATPGW